MAQFDFDLFVIGAGSGGVRAARMAAGKGLRVAVAEDMFLGGTCVNVGCVPKKLFVYGAHYMDDFHEAAGFGWNLPSPPEFDWITLRDNKSNEIKRLNGVYQSLLDNAGATLVQGRATVTGPQEVEVNGQRYRAERILVATGGWPFIPEFPGSEHVISSNEVFELEAFPKDVIVVGGGYIAVEFAGIFNGLGAKTTQLYRGELFLRGFDQDVREFVAQELEKKGIALKFNTDIEVVEKLPNGRLKAVLNSGETLEADQILYATGRKAKTDGLGLEEVGVELRKDGSIVVDDYYQTSVPSIFALGDVKGGIQLTPVALAEAMTFLAQQYEGSQQTLDYNLIATAVFCQPNIGTVGLTEQQALEQLGDIQVFRSSFRALKHTLSGSDEKVLMKMIVDAKTDRVVGIHMVGPEAGEIIQGMAIAMKAGATKAVFDQTIGIHPTSAEEFVTMRTPV
ncbi:MAG: glutathione-disulfide reductase [Pseudomonadales bacterium]